MPEKLDVASEASKTVIFFRSREVRDKTEVNVLVNGLSVYKRKFMKLKPPEMERIEVDFIRVKAGDSISLEMREA